ncbi:hypothetical protein [Paraburkholderia sp. BL10I2N1]|uniref:hypothetical protein n=1 Tax=Paraburkholderia sp. BL10I2N1 TaxID=1938796 RepID=UPI00105B8324|nr:hypothetical protein [Paraburkholderia sp. BL10I2N1]TDN62984.1 hypothetical protein B0G77_6581 [Paraburkholderia sp. BL10I2N1]
MRAVMVAVAVGLFSSAAMAAGQYVEVWNPPETSQHSNVKKRKPAVKAPKHAVTQTRRQLAQCEAGGVHKTLKVSSKPTPEKPKPRVSVVMVPSKDAQQRQPKAQGLPTKSSRPQATTKVADTSGSASGRTTPSASGRDLPPILR